MASTSRKADKQHRAEQAQMAALGIPDFETAEACATRQAQMIRGLTRLGVKAKHLAQLHACDPAECAPGTPCSEVCHYATRRQRLSLITQGHELLAEHPGPLASVTIAHPAWEVAYNSLKTTPVKAAKQWLRQRLRTLQIPNLLAIGSFETCLNVERDKSRLWGGQFHLIIAGATTDELKEALALGPVRA